MILEFGLCLPENFKYRYILSHQILKLTDWEVWYSDCGALVMLKNALTAPNGPEASIKQSQ